MAKVYADNYPTIPMVAESPVKFECKYHSTHRIKGNSPVGSIDVVFATVETIHIDEAYVTADGKLDIPRIQPIARLGYFDYTMVRETFEMRVPGSDTDAQMGREGRPQ